MQWPRWCSLLAPAAALLAGTVAAQVPGDAHPRLAFPAAERAATTLGFEDALTGPALTATADDIHLRLLVARAARDSALVRAVLREASEAYARLGARSAPPPFLLAEAEAWLGDTGAARARMQAFAERRGAMDPRVRWADIPNGALLARAESVRARLSGATGAVPGDAPAVRLPRRTPGTWRWRYDAEIRTRLPFGTPIDTAVPTVRMALVVDESLDAGAPPLALRTAVRGVAVDLPALARAGDAGQAFLRTLLAALRGGAVSALVDADGRVRDRQAGPADVAGSGVAPSLLLAMGPLAFAPRLPEGMLSVGATWTDTVRVAAPLTALGDAAFPLPATMRLTAIRVHEGRTLAVIALDAGARDRPLGHGTERADITLSGEVVLDAADGLPLRTAASLRATVTDGRGARTPVRVLVTALRQTAPATESTIARR